MNKINYDEKNRLFISVLTDLCERTRLKDTWNYIQHGNTTVFEHSAKVAYYSLVLAAKIGKTDNASELIRGALLHDYFLYDWHIKEARPIKGLHGFTHPYTAYKNALKELPLTQIETDIIKKHMFPLTPIPPRFKESIIVCVIDKICSTCETLRLDSCFQGYSRYLITVN